jgi:DNA polymerase iota
VFPQQDYDCFYASVFEVEQPVLKTLPLAVQQKQIVVTCNYEARRRGLRKLQLIKEAKQLCPELVIVLGEDLTKFRDASKNLYLFLRAFSWSGRVEKLGFDEVCLTSFFFYSLVPAPCSPPHPAVDL